jgi:hypothetical protein
VPAQKTSKKTPAGKKRRRDERVEEATEDLSAERGTKALTLATTPRGMTIKPDPDYVTSNRSKATLRGRNPALIKAEDVEAILDAVPHFEEESVKEDQEIPHQQEGREDEEDVGLGSGCERDTSDFEVLTSETEA